MNHYTHIIDLAQEVEPPQDGIEPTDNTTQFMAFRIGYAVFGVGCLIGIGFLISKTLRK